MPVSSLPDRAIQSSAHGWPRLIQAFFLAVHPAFFGRESGALAKTAAFLLSAPGAER